MFSVASLYILMLSYLRPLLLQTSISISHSGMHVLLLLSQWTFECSKSSAVYFYRAYLGPCRESLQINSDSLLTDKWLA
ncbi:MAG: hypothetical protein EXX96DRAFT_570624 [Benjaminiella poitrasii]|nr:MAG: hypothetical protein EXX96DRAFT_570624 [Benjaminiella poitrasii]